VVASTTITTLIMSEGRVQCRRPIAMSRQLHERLVRLGLYPRGIYG
jgi:hypothetical protein